MPQYIRAFVPGGTFFFMVTMLECRRKLLTENIDNLREVFKVARRRRPFTIEAIVILPDHLHCSRLHPLQSGKAWSGYEGGGLAVFKLSSIHGTRHL
jgi:REP element-mobilizing transposase RayT